MRVSADSDEAGEPGRVAQPRFPSHEAALGEAENHGLFGGESFLTLLIKESEKELAAADDAGAGVAIEVIPRKAAIIRIRGVDE